MIDFNNGISVAGVATLPATTTFAGPITLPAGSTAPGVLGSASPTVAAAGTNQATATVLNSDVNVVTTVAAGTGVVVIGATSGKYAVIVNKGANALLVYPAVTHQFDGLGVNIPISLPVNGFLEMFGSSTTQWHTTLNSIINGSMVVGNIPGVATGTLVSPTFTGVPAAPTAAPGTNTTQVATTAFTVAALAALVAASPAALDTLNELALALGNDANFATTITNALALKAPLASPVLTGVPLAPTAAPATNTTQVATTAFVDAVRVILAAATALKADTASPALSGTPTAPTAATTTNNTQIATTAFATPKTSATGSIILSAGTTAQRDGTPLAGYTRFNSTIGQFEGYNGTKWDYLSPVSGTRNIVINGDMRVDQRQNGAVVILNNSAAYITDRWQVAMSAGVGTGTGTAQRVLDAPPGFVYSLKVTCTTAKVATGADGFYIYQPIEGLNAAHVAFGTSAAKPVTLSFWVKSSIVGNFSGFIRAYAGVATRTFTYTYTINAINTWEYKTITAPGDTVAFDSFSTAGTFAVLFDLGSGPVQGTAVANTWQTGDFWHTTTSTAFFTNVNATINITGVQLEVGPFPTPFEVQTIANSIITCKRYFERVDHWSNTLMGIYDPTTTAFQAAIQPFTVAKRINPLFTNIVLEGSAFWTIPSTTAFSGVNPVLNCLTNLTHFAVFQARTAGGAAPIGGNTYSYEGNGYLLFNAEI
jgi:hypothetical protein